MNFSLIIPIGIVAIIIIIALFSFGHSDDSKKHKDDWKDHLKK